MAVTDPFDGDEASMPPHVARMVVITAYSATWFAPAAVPPLKPIQPIMSMPTPMSISGRLCGRIAVPVCRRPSTIARARPAAPAFMWMAVPPA